MDKDFLLKLLDADISRDLKEKVLSYWLLPREEGATTPIQKVHAEGKSGAVRRPTKEQLELRADPKKAEGQKEMEETLKEVVEDEE